MVREIEKETRRENATRGRAPLGAAHVLAQELHARPYRSDRSPAPLVHAATRRAREAFQAVYQAFVDAFRAATERVRQAETAVDFPRYAFPPAAPFVDGRRRASASP